MSCKGFQYKYKLKTPYPQEYEAANFAYTQAGWLDVGFEEKNGIPSHIIFEWPHDRPPYYPFVNWP